VKFHAAGDRKITDRKLDFQGNLLRFSSPYALITFATQNRTKTLNFVVIFDGVKALIEYGMKLPEPFTDATRKPPPERQLRTNPSLRLAPTASSLRSELTSPAPTSSLQLFARKP
jgi:hypothetical protein